MGSNAFILSDIFPFMTLAELRGGGGGVEKGGGRRGYPGVRESEDR